MRLLAASLLLASLPLIFSLHVQTNDDTPLDVYVNTPDSNYKYVDTGVNFSAPKLEKEVGLGWTAYVLNMTSQRWLTEADVDCSLWWHLMVVVVPDHLEHTDTALVYATGGSAHSHIPTDAKDEDIALVVSLAVTGRAIGVALFQIPFQPCQFSGEAEKHGRSEDALIAWTWQHFLEQPDQPNWLLRLPMTKAVVRAFDTTIDFASKKGLVGEGNAISKFVMAGASKRGWTTWTVAAVDKRVVAMVPIVMDALNFLDNVHHFYRNLGGWTFAFKDYYALNLTARFDDPNMAKLTAIVDPYVYRDRIADIPKLICSTTDDEFFQMDDSHYYYNNMPGSENHLLMLQNSEHSCATAIPELVPAVHAFLASVLKGQPRPQMKWTLDNSTGEIVMTTSNKPEHVYLRHAHTLPSQAGHRKDFRWIRADIDCPKELQIKDMCLQPIVWSGNAILPDSTEGGVYTYRARMNAPEEGYVAFFLEAKFKGTDIIPFTFTTETSILPLGFPFPDCKGAECRGTLV